MSLSITAMLEERIEVLRELTLSTDWDISRDANSSVNEIDFLLPQVRTLEEAKKMRDEGCGPNYEDVKWFLTKLIERLEALPQDDGCDSHNCIVSLLEELPRFTRITQVDKDFYNATYENPFNSPKEKRTATGKTAFEALLSLKSQLHLPPTT